MLPVDRIPYRRWFPWLRLSQAIGIALSLRQLVVALAAILCLWLGHSIVERIAPEPSFSVELLDILWQTRVPREFHATWVPRPTMQLSRPWHDVLDPGVALLQWNVDLARRIRWAGHLTWSLAVWSLFGVALCRLAGQRFSRDEEGSFRKAFQFGMSRWSRGIVAPLIPGAAALLIILMSCLLALSGRVPVIGSLFALLVSPVLAILSLTAAWLLIAIALGWPLMLAAVAMDDCDGFGGLSRSYSMWTGRPWYYVWCLFVSACLGTIALYLVGELAHWVLSLSGATIYWSTYGMQGPEPSGPAIQFLVALVLKAYCISFFWTSATITYALLRQSVDSVPLDIIASGEKPVREPFPVAGIPAVHQPTE
jgi:hypothetical protein